MGHAGPQYEPKALASVKAAAAAAAAAILSVVALKTRLSVV